jgi:hypothetical protein
VKRTRSWCWLIFGVIAIFCALLFAFQRSDLERVAGTSARGTERTAAEGGGTIENPTTMAEPELWAALAGKPIGREAIQARTQMWDAGQRSRRLGMIAYGSVRALAPGGEMDSGYERSAWRWRRSARLRLTSGRRKGSTLARLRDRRHRRSESIGGRWRRSNSAV